MGRPDRPSDRSTVADERPARRALAALCWSLSALLLTAAATTAWAWWRIDRPDALAAVVDEALTRPAVERFIAERAAADLDRRAPGLADPAEVRLALAGLARAPAFHTAIRTAVAALDRTARSDRTPRLDRAEQVYAVVLELLRTERPDLARRLPDASALDSFRLTPPGAVGTAVRDLHRAGIATVPLLVLGAAAGAIGARLTPPGRRRRRSLALAFVTGALVAGVAGVLPFAAAARLPAADRAAARAVAGVLVGPLLQLALVGLGTGVALTALVRLRAHGRRGVTAVAAAAAVSVSAVAAGVAAHHLVGRTPEADRCLGSVALCDRTFDRVTLAGTHNSMNDARDGFLVPEHRLAIGEQLDRGIRALLVDTHEGRRAPDGLVWTAIEVDGPDRAKLVDRYGPELVDRVVALRNASTRPAAERRLYLCHNLCELGATEYVEALRRLRHWLLAHPDEVVVLFVQDESPPEDNIAAVRAAGLEPLTFAHGEGDAWPTLRELVRTDRRLFVVAEHRGGGAPFYQEAFPLYRDTSFDVPRADAFTCAVNRGTATSPLFLLNHWVETRTPSPAQAAVVNQPDVIVDRARRCRDEGGRLPNIVAVNFSDEGDVRAAVDRLNREG